MILLQRQWQKLLEFLFPSETDTWLSVFRIGMGLQAVVYALLLKSDWTFSPCFRQRARVLLAANWARPWLRSTVRLFRSLAGSWLLASMSASKKKQFFPLLGPVCSAWDARLLLGLFCRPAAIIAWFLHVCAAESGGLLAYGADNFMTIGLFYLMLSPLPDRYSLDRQLVKTQLKSPQLLGFWRRVLQVHLCFVYFFGGLGNFSAAVGGMGPISGER